MLKEPLPFFSFLDIVLFLGVSQGLFLAISLQLLHNKNKSANRVLSLLLFIASLLLFGRVLAFRPEILTLGRFGILADATIFIFGPLFYTYVRRLLFSEIPAFRLKWIHYLPLGLNILYFIVMLTVPKATFVDWVRSGKLNWSYFIVELMGLCSFSYYIWSGAILWKNYSGREKKEFSFSQGIRIFVLLLLGTLTLLTLLWWISFVSLYGFRKYHRFVNYNTMWIVTPVFIYVIGYFSLRQPEIFRLKPTAERPKGKDRLDPSEIQQLQKRLHFFMQEEQVFTQQDLTLNALSEKMNTTPNNLSWLLNQVYQQRFYDYVNSFRMRAFLKKIDNGEHKRVTLFALALESGFNSKTTFNKVFKAETGLTPTQYIKQQNVA
ncbi:MAG: helix-turn-helix domain-containing protein [Bacteroidota bacterium]